MATLKSNNVLAVNEQDFAPFIDRKVILSTMSPNGDDARGVIATLESVTIEYGKPQRTVALTMRGTTVILRGAAGHRPSDEFRMTTIPEA